MCIMYKVICYATFLIEINIKRNQMLQSITNLFQIIHVHYFISDIIFIFY